MKHIPDIRLQHIVTAAMSGIFYLLSFRLNQTFDSTLAYATGVSLVFLPAGVKLLAILIGRLPAFIGLLAASVYISPSFWPDKPLSSVLYFAIMGVVTYPIAIFAVMHGFRIHHDLRNLRYSHIVILSVVASAFNGILHNVLFLFEGVTANEELWLKSAAMSFGDFMGCFVLVALFHTGSRWLRRQVQPHASSE